MGINSYALANRIEAAVPKQYVVAGPIDLTTGVVINSGLGQIWVTEAVFYGYRSIGSNTLPVPNTDPAWISGEITIQRFLDPVPAGGNLAYAPWPGIKFNLANLFLLGTTGDRIYIKYLS